MESWILLFIYLSTYSFDAFFRISLFASSTHILFSLSFNYFSILPTGSLPMVYPPPSFCLFLICTCSLKSKCCIKSAFPFLRLPHPFFYLFPSTISQFYLVYLFLSRTCSIISKYCIPLTYPNHLRAFLFRSSIIITHHNSCWHNRSTFSYTVHTCTLSFC